MIKVKVSCSEEKNQNILIRQTPDSKGIWKNCKFFINENIKNPDWWFVLHGSGIKNKETVKCDPENIVYISLEASERQNKVSKNFLEQFSQIVISDKTIQHKNILYHNGTTWYVGINVQRKGNKHYFENKTDHNYNFFKNLKVSNKLDRISLIISNKNNFPGHRKRLKFVQALMNSSIGKFIDFYGHGFNDIPDKLDTLIKYKYHLVLENNSIDTYWSEKLGDAYLGFTLPIYYGCKNLDEYFDKNSFVQIDINNIKESIQTIHDLLNKNIYKEKLEFIIDSRNKVLDDYNIFNLMYKIISKKKDIYHRQELSILPNEYFVNNFFLRLIKKILLRNA